MTQAPSIHLRGACHIDGVPVFSAIDMTLAAGEWTCLLGRSGVGKSTLLRLIAGSVGAGDFEGQIATSDGLPLAGRVSVMAQSDMLLPWLSVLENTVLGARLRGEAPDLHKARDLLSRVGLSEHAGKTPQALSGGMRQRTALARTLMEDRPVVLLDEPFSALDAGTRADMQDLAARLLKDKTILLVTHDPAEAVRLGHQIIVLAPDAATPWALPSCPPVRDQYAPDTVACQAALLAHLRGRP